MHCQVAAKPGSDSAPQPRSLPARAARLAAHPLARARRRGGAVAHVAGAGTGGRGAERLPLLLKVLVSLVLAHLDDIVLALAAGLVEVESRLGALAPRAHDGRGVVAATRVGTAADGWVLHRALRALRLARP
eukprot:356247-Chlamydomonas_euryale.AAC.4